jgi:hypothetical protein
MRRVRVQEKYERWRKSVGKGTHTETKKKKYIKRVSRRRKIGRQEKSALKRGMNHPSTN